MGNIEKMVVISNNPDMVYLLIVVLLSVFIISEVIQIFVIRARHKRLQELVRKLKKLRRHR